MSTFTKKVGCAALSCRKVLLLAAVAAMAFGAQAGEATTEGETTGGTKVYTFTFDLKNIPAQDPVTEHPNHNFIYLADTAGNVIFYVDRDKEMDKDPDTGYWSLKAQDGSKVVTHAATSTPGYTALEGKNVIAHTLTAATIKKTGTGGANDRTFSVTFTSLQSMDSYVAEWYDDKGGRSQNLLAVVTYAGGDESCVEYKVDAQPGLGRTGPDAAGYTLTASAAYAVPEPTSAMLLLLGVAGLALKRKQVA